MDRTVQARFDQDPRARAAAEWFLELRSGDVSMERIGEWQRWLATDAANKLAFEQIESFWHMGSQAVTTRWPTDAEVDDDAYDGEGSISEWRNTSETRRGTLQRAARIGLPLVAGIAVLTVVLAWLVPMWRGHTSVSVTNAVGETRTTTLPDGSTVAAGGDTELMARFTRDAREVTLERGEAFFHVAKDAVRPFTVRAGRTAITAIGTSFNVRRAGERVVVAVSEGAVRVGSPQSALFRAAKATSPTRLEAGQQVSVEPGVPMLQVSPVDPRAVAGWRQGRLQYLDEPLETVVADLARYSTREIHIADPTVANLRVTGIVFEQNIDGWLASLQATFPVEVARDASGRVTLRPASP